MKTIIKTLAALMSAFVILTCALPAASAAQTAPCPQIEVIRCDGEDCGDLQGLIERLCSDRGICLNDILKNINGLCNNGAACVNIPDLPVQAPTENITEPSETPSNPIEAPTEKPAEPAVTPDKPTDAPTEPTVAEQPVTPEFNTAYEAEVVRLVNIERSKYGLAPLSIDEGAVEVAHLRAKEIVQSFSHTRPNGSSCFTAAQEAGVSYRYAGENIAYGYPTPEQVVNGWMNSEGHRKNILSASFSKIGVGCYESKGVLYWSQFFIG